MEKKYFAQPYLKVTHITPSIIATSLGSVNNIAPQNDDPDNNFAPGRYDDFEDEY